jgi:hypothetical protein
MINQWDGTGDGITNVILYNHSNPQNKSTTTFLSLKKENIQVAQINGTADNPNDIRLQVSIVNYKFNLYTPFIARSFTNKYAVVESAPILYRN